MIQVTSRELAFLLDSVAGAQVPLRNTEALADIVRRLSVFASGDKIIGVLRDNAAPAPADGG